MASTVKDIARVTGLSLTTISKYMNGGNVLDENCVLIEDAIKKLDYKVNRFARGLKTNKSMIVGIIISGIKSIFSTTIIEVIEDILRKSGYGVIVCDSRKDIKLEAELVEFLLDLRVDGIMNIPISNSPNHLFVARKKNIPIVVMDVLYKNFCCDSIITSNMDGAYEATEYLINQGHKKIGIITGDKNTYTAMERLNGYKKALKKYDIQIEEKNIILTDFTMVGGYEGAKKIFNQQPDITALFTTNYYLTLGAYMAINEKKIKIPSELSLVGFDKFDLYKVIKPTLSTVSQPVNKIAERAAKIILERLKNGPCTEEDLKRIILPTTFIKGESITKIKSNI